MRKLDCKIRRITKLKRKKKYIRLKLGLRLKNPNHNIGKSIEVPNSLKTTT